MNEKLVFKNIVLALLYLAMTFGFMGFVVSSLISSKSTLEVACGAVGAAFWLFVTIYIALKIINRGQSADNKGKKK